MDVVRLEKRHEWASRWIKEDRREDTVYEDGRVFTYSRVRVCFEV